MTSPEIDGLLGTDLSAISPYGPSKRYLDKVIWHSQKQGAVGVFQIRPEDTRDHFGLFRGVDQVEAFAQVAAGALLPWYEAQKEKIPPSEFYKRFTLVAGGIERVRFHGPVRESQFLVSVAHIDFYRFRSMTLSGHCFVADTIEAASLCTKGLSANQLCQPTLGDLNLVAEVHGVGLRAIKSERLSSSGKE